jgi:hypothetical protein
MENSDLEKCTPEQGRILAEIDPHAANDTIVAKCAMFKGERVQVCRTSFAPGTGGQEQCRVRLVKCKDIRVELVSGLTEAAIVAILADVFSDSRQSFK